jgi:hypothetical protein
MWQTFELTYFYGESQADSLILLLTNNVCPLYLLKTCKQHAKSRERVEITAKNSFGAPLIKG